MSSVSPTARKKIALRFYSPRLPLEENTPDARRTTHALTFEIERLVPSRIQRAPFDFCLESVLLVRKQRYTYVRIGSARQVLRRQVFTLEQIGCRCER